MDEHRDGKPKGHNATLKRASISENGKGSLSFDVGLDSLGWRDCKGVL